MAWAGRAYASGAALILATISAHADAAGVYQGTAATWSSLRHLGHFLRPPLPTLEQLLTPLDTEQHAALEIGCGEGHALLELQSRFPRAQCHCLSSKTWDCKRRNGSHAHHQFACTASTNDGILLDDQLPMMYFGNFGQPMPFANESLDFIYSQHALNTLPSPGIRFAPFMSEIARLLRPNGTALLQLIPCCMRRTRTLTYGNKRVYSGSKSHRFEMIDDRTGCEAAGFERVTIFRAPEFEPKSEAQDPCAFVLLAHKAMTSAQCPTEPASAPTPKRKRLDKQTAYLQEFLDAIHAWLHRVQTRSNATSPRATAGHPHPSRRTSPRAAKRLMRLKDVYVSMLYGNISERRLISTRVRDALGTWHVQPSGSLAKYMQTGASKFTRRLRSCVRLSDKVFESWQLATSRLAACRAAPASCSLCQFQDKGDRFFVAIHAAASMQSSTWAASHILWVLAGLGCLFGLLCRQASRKRSDASTHWRRTPLNLLAVFWSHGHGFAHPIATVKLALLLLLSVDLLGIGAPELNILAAPELIAHVRSHPVLPAELLPGVVANLTGMFMPDLCATTADMYSARLAGVRWVLLVSWAIFLVLPTVRLPRMSFGCYLLGAASYVTLGSLALMYNLAHSTQSSILFVTASTLAVFDLGHNPRAAVWLRQFLFLCVITPVYLFSGMSKIRYIGLHRQITGSWMLEDVVLGSASMYLRASLPSLNELVLHAPGGLMLMSLGNFALEVATPIGVLLSAPFSNTESFFRAAMCLLALSFHSLVFLLMGPNFVRHSMLVVIALDPLSVVALRAEGAPGTAAPGAADRLRGAAAVGALLGWFYVQIHSDASHLLEYTAPNKKIDSYWPIPEMSMFAKPSAGVSFRTTGGLSTLLLVAFLLRMRRSADNELRRQQQEAPYFNS